MDAVKPKSPKAPLIMDYGFSLKCSLRISDKKASSLLVLVFSLSSNDRFRIFFLISSAFVASSGISEIDCAASSAWGPIAGWISLYSFSSVRIEVTRPRKAFKSRLVYIVLIFYYINTCNFVTYCYCFVFNFYFRVRDFVWLWLVKAIFYSSSINSRLIKFYCLSF